MQHAACKVGVEPRTDAEIKNIIGLAMREAVAVLYPSMSDDAFEVFLREYSTRYVELDQAPCQFFDGVSDTLAHLKSQGFTLSVATGKSRAGLNRVLKNLCMSDFFDSSRCADETASKPDPLMLQQLLEQHQIDVNHAVMIGDTEWDMSMADAIGMRKVAVSYGAHEKARLESCNPDWLIDDFSDLKSWVF